EFFDRSSQLQDSAGYILHGNYGYRFELRTFLQVFFENIVVPRPGIHDRPLGINHIPVSEPRGGIENGKLQSRLVEILEPVFGADGLIENAFAADSLMLHNITPL